MALTSLKMSVDDDGPAVRRDIYSCMQTEIDPAP